MVCTRVPMPGGGVAIICQRGQRRPRCSACKAAPATRQCDWPLTGAKAGRTCDANLCDSCAVSAGPDVDHCPAHARHARQLELRDASPPAYDPAVLAAHCRMLPPGHERLAKPLCDACVESWAAAYRRNSRVAGYQWGARIAADHLRRGGDPPPFVSFDGPTEASARLRARAVSLVRHFAGADERVREVLARECVYGAMVVYEAWRADRAAAAR
jgi:hypothetical protein